MLAVNSAEEEKVKPVEKNDYEVTESGFKAELSPASWNVIVLKKA